MNTLKEACVRCCAHGQEESINCIKDCAAPAHNAGKIVEYEMDNFYGKLERSLKVCKDRFERAKVHDGSINYAMKDLELADTVNVIPPFADRLKANLSAED